MTNLIAQEASKKFSIDAWRAIHGRATRVQKILIEFFWPFNCLFSSFRRHFLKKCANPGLFFIYFWSFQRNKTIFATNECEKMSCPSSICRRHLNPRPLEHESSPTTTRPELPPIRLFLICKIDLQESWSSCCGRRLTVWR